MMRRGVGRFHALLIAMVLSRLTLGELCLSVLNVYSLEIRASLALYLLYVRPQSSQIFFNLHRYPILTNKRSALFLLLTLLIQLYSVLLQFRTTLCIPGIMAPLVGIMMKWIIIGRYEVRKTLNLQF